MLQKLYEVVIQKLPIDIKDEHPLHVGINNHDFKKIYHFNESLPLQNRAIAVLLKENLPISELPDNLFILIYAIKLDHSIKGEKCISLYVSEQFLNNYALSVGDLMLLKTATCFPLEKIVIGSKTAKSYTFFQDFKLFKDLLLQSCNRNLLFREGDMVLANAPENNTNGDAMILESLVLDCAPFGQGIPTTATSIIVVDISEVSHLFERNLSTDFYENTKEENTSDDNLSDLTSIFHLMNYTSTLVSLPKSPCSESKMAAHSIPFLVPTDKIKTLHHKFKIHIVHKFYKEFVKEIAKIKVVFDPLNTIFVTQHALKKLNMQGNGWVKIRLCKIKKQKRTDSALMLKAKEDQNRPTSIAFCSNLLPSKKSYRMAYICSFSDESVIRRYFESNRIVYMTPHLWFNLNEHPSKLVQPDSRLQIEPCEELSLPLYANEVHAPLVQSPNYNAAINFDKLVYDFFETPRYICKEDIFSIDSRGLVDFHMKDHDQDLYKSPIIYFRISNIEGKQKSTGYLIDSKHCRLYQTGTSNSYIPAAMETFYSDGDHPIWDSPTPKGLIHYTDTIQDLILPFLNLKNVRCQFSSNILLTGHIGCGKTTVVKAVAKCLNLHLYQINCHQLAGESSATTEARLKIMLDKGSLYAPCIILFKNIHFIGKEKEINNEDSRVLHSFCQLLKSLNNSDHGWPIIVIGCTTDQKLLSNDIFSAFLHHVHMEPPNEEERMTLLQDLLSVCIKGNDLSVLYMAQRTAGFVLGDLCALVERAIRNAYKRVRKIASQIKPSEVEEEDMVLAGIPVVQRDLLKALEELQSNYADAIGAPKIPNVLFEDVGGLANVKREILDTIQLPLEHPEMLLAGLRRSGLLLYGPPGTGKTLLAKAVATECSLNFLSVKGPELINMYVGQSEENVRAVFAEARSAVPCVIFFDELDSLAPNRGRSGDSGGVMDRVVSQLLAELDGLNKKSDVFVIGATNRPDLIDPALLRPGRFDRLLYVGIPEDKESKICVLKALTRKFPLAQDVDLGEIVEKCPTQLSGADLYALCSNAVLKRVEKNVDLIEKQNLDPEDVSNDVQKDDFFDALQSLVPSVSPEQLTEYQQIKLNF